MDIKRVSALSIVLPVFNEEGCIIDVLSELYEEVEKLNLNDFEIIVVDDGSTDKSNEYITKFQEKNNNLKLYTLARNFGQSAAMACGIDNAQFDVVITMDSDGQNNPKDIHKLIREIEKGFDVVSGWRKNRKDSTFSRKIPSYLANKLISNWTGLNLHDYGCTLKAYKKRSIQSFPIYGEVHRFLPAYASFQGAKITEVEVDHRFRTTGVSKYGIGRTQRVILDILVARAQSKFSMRPMHLLGGAGLILSLIGLILVSISVILKITGEWDFVDSPLPVVGGFTTIFGMQLLLIGLLAEFQLRLVMREGKLKPYVIR